jgi:hypothetical protein
VPRRTASVPMETSCSRPAPLACTDRSAERRATSLGSASVTALSLSPDCHQGTATRGLPQEDATLPGNRHAAWRWHRFPVIRSHGSHGAATHRRGRAPETRAPGCMVGRGGGQSAGYRAQPPVLLVRLRRGAAPEGVRRVAALDRLSRCAGDRTRAREARPRHSRRTSPPLDGYAQELTPPERSDRLTHANHPRGRVAASSNGRSRGSAATGA